MNEEDVRRIVREELDRDASERNAMTEDFVISAILKRLRKEVLDAGDFQYSFSDIQ